MAITAAADSGDEVLDDQGVALPSRWEAIACVEGVLSGDGRLMHDLGARPLPVPLQFLATVPDYGGHDGAVAAGLVDVVERWADNPAVILAGGSFDLGGEDGRECARMVREQIVRFVSVELTEMSYEYVYTDWDYDDWGDMYPTDGYASMTGNIAALTVVMTPCFYQCVIVPEGGELDMSTIPQAATGGPLELITAGGASMELYPTPDVPPAAWFDNPNFERPQESMTITADGRVFGHAAFWGTPHIGHMGQTVLAPRSRTDYAYFRRGTTICLDDESNEVPVRTGPLTMGTNHANTDPRLGAVDMDTARSHYDHTGAAVADLAVGEDEHGIWFAGAVRPGTTNLQVRVLRAGGVSGDWRETRRGSGQLEFMHLLAVNVPGFPTALAAAAGVETAEVDPRPRVASVADGALAALVAAGRPRPHRSGSIDALAPILRRIDDLEKVTSPLRQDRARQAADRWRRAD